MRVIHDVRKRIGTEKGVRFSSSYSGVFNVLKFMYIRSGQSQVSIISWASAVEGCPLGRVPL